MKNRDQGSEIRDQFAAAPLGIMSEDDAGSEAEIARRVAEIEAGTAKTCSLEELLADMRAALGQ